MIKDRERGLNANLKPDLPSKSVQNVKDNKFSIVSKLEQNKAKLETGQSDAVMQHKEKEHMGAER